MLLPVLTAAEIGKGIVIQFAKIDRDLVCNGKGKYLGFNDI